MVRISSRFFDETSAECTVCHEVKSHSEFHKRPAGPWGLTSSCKKCAAAYERERHKRKLRLCLFCGEQFFCKQSGGSQIYCSEECNKEAKETKELEKIVSGACEYCGYQYRYKLRKNSNTFCSRNCANLNRQKNNQRAARQLRTIPPLPCPECEVIFDPMTNERGEPTRLPRKYCSKHCASLFKVKKHQAQWSFEKYRHIRLKKYHISIEKYDELFRIQGGLCGACGRPEIRESRGKVVDLSIDHDHACCPGGGSCGNCVRGLLCSRCNSGLGMAEDRVDILLKMVDYLQRTSRT